MPQSAQQKPWYAFMGGDYTSGHDRTPFSGRPAMRWLIATLLVVALWVGVVTAIVTATPRTKVATIGLLGLFVPTSMPFVLAALIAALHATQDVLRALWKALPRNR